jgi:hypothetical protein
MIINKKFVITQQKLRRNNKNKMTKVFTDLTNTYPVDFNGYVVVARPLLKITANQVKAGDLVITDGYISKIHSVNSVAIAGHGDGIELNGELNMIRFPHEIVTVLRREEIDELSSGS